MRFSQSFIPTLRDDPADAEAVSHKLLVRGGFVRQLMSGVYSLLPLGQRVAEKVERIIREEMDRIGGQEFKLPALHPAEVWQQSGRWDVIGEELMRFRDRHGADVCLGMTHEEVFTWIARELRSYRQLPQLWYQLQTKFRDEARPKSGLLRVREFVMKDSYSFDLDQDGLDLQFQRHFEAYRRIFDRCGLDPLAVEASSGAMGGSESIEFMVPSDAGEDWIASCSACGYAANVERASSLLLPITDEAGPDAPEKFATPGLRSIEDIAAFSGGAEAERQIKTLVMVADDVLRLVLLRGDHQLNEQKLADALGATACRPAQPEEIRDALGASAGSLGAVGVTGVPILADLALEGRTNMTTGANEDDFHLRGVSVARDLAVDQFLDLREVKAGEPCPACENPLAVEKTIEVGHIFKLGTKYSESLSASVLDEAGKSRPIIMGSYGIGVGRTLAAVLERHHDDAGMIWPVNVAPYEVVVSVLNPKDVETSQVGERLYEAFQERRIDVLLDDRDERPGVKFKDADLIGIPHRLTVGPKGLANGKVEWVRRGREGRRDLDVNKAADHVSESVLEDRR
ncbi:MAG: proline--tRNA ligase [Myxococcales bacterium]|nr:proline--tRNA ligase [Myxococcales bacterium]